MTGSRSTFKAWMNSTAIQKMSNCAGKKKSLLIKKSKVLSHDCVAKKVQGTLILTQQGLI